MENIEAQREILELIERYVVALRFHDQPERAEHYEHLAMEMREELLTDELSEKAA